MAEKKSKGTPCKVMFHTRYGYFATPLDAPSIAAGVRMAKGSGWYRYLIVVDGCIVRKGYCD